MVRDVETLKIQLANIKDLKENIRRLRVLPENDPFCKEWLGMNPKDKKSIELDFLRDIKSRKLNDIKVIYFKMEQSIQLANRSIIVVRS